MKLIQVERSRIQIFKDIAVSLRNEIEELKIFIGKESEENKKKKELNAFLEQQDRFNKESAAFMAKAKQNVKKMMQAKNQKEFNIGLGKVVGGYQCK